MSVFGDLVSEQARAAWAQYDGPGWEFVWELFDRKVPSGAAIQSVLADDAVIDVSGALTCDAVMRRWLGLLGEENAGRRRAALDLQEALHGFEMERAARPPQVIYSVPANTPPAQASELAAFLGAPVPETPGPSTLPVPAVHPARPGLIETTHQFRQFVRNHLGR
jgi:hypothetical protein